MKVFLNLTIAAGIVALPALTLISPLAYAQAPARELTRVTAEDLVIDLDGALDESVWGNIPVIDDMRVIQPDTLANSSERTETRLFYTAQGIYVGVVNFQAPSTLLPRMSSRDRDIQRDGFRVVIDASGSGLYGYSMRINLGDSMSDATVLPERLLNREWDGSWNARTQVTEEGWTAEFFIPWSMMALPQQEEVRTIGIYLEREVAGLGEIWSWPALPETGNGFLSGFQHFTLRDISSSTTQLTYYPYVSTTIDNLTNDVKYRTGTEIFWRPSSNTQLSATLNPDFGNVESDSVVVNLTAFETFYPEKRPFFLEGQDIFNTTPRSETGPRAPTTLLNTRRIGRAAQYTVAPGIAVEPTALSQPTDLLGATKFTGQSGNVRYGALLAAEDDSHIRGYRTDGSAVKLKASGRDFAAARLLYEGASESGRRSIGWMGTNTSYADRDAMVNGVDLHYFSADARWTVDGQLMYSDVDGVTGAGGFADALYQPARGIQHRIRSTYMDDTLDLNDLGFLSRNDHIQLDYDYSKTVSNLPGLRSLTTGYQIVNQWNTQGLPVRLGLLANRNYTFEDNSYLRVDVRYFNPRVDDRLGRGTGTFRVPERWNVIMDWHSDQASLIAYGLTVDGNQSDLGKKDLETTAALNLRPTDNFSLALSVKYGVKEGLLVHRGGGRYTSFEATQWSPELELDYFITAKQQLRFSAQWTGLKAYEDRFYRVNRAKLDDLQQVPNPDNVSDDFLVSRMTFQIRYRWELAPLSDLYVVYTRGGNLMDSTFEEYPELLMDAWTDRIVDTLAIKLRYRFGS